MEVGIKTRSCDPIEGANDVLGSCSHWSVEVFSVADGGLTHCHGPGSLDLLSYFRSKNIMTFSLCSLVFRTSRPTRKASGRSSRKTPTEHRCSSGGGSQGPKQEARTSISPAVLSSSPGGIPRRFQASRETQISGGLAILKCYAKTSRNIS